MSCSAARQSLNQTNVILSEAKDLLLLDDSLEKQILRGVYREPLRSAQSDSKRSESAQNDMFWNSC
ncbi:MAG: hypothetical protein ACRD18_07650 [Terriglobia bacterium]